MDCQFHGHDHGHGHDHDHDDHIPPPNTNQSQTLYSHIDLLNVQALNVTDPSVAPKIIRKYEERFMEEPVLESDVDEELIIVVPFTGLVKLHSVLLRSLGDDTSPDIVNLYKDKPQLDFETASSTTPVQSLNYPESVGAGLSASDGGGGIVEFAVNRPKFSNMTSLTIHIPSNRGADQTKLLYIGLRGEFSELRRAPVIAQYEAAANPADHKTATRNLELGGNELD